MTSGDGPPAAEIVSRPGPALLAAAGDLIARAEAVDDASPLNEAGLLALAHPDAGGHPGHVQHLVATRSGTVVGYAQLTDDGTGQVVVDPVERREGVGSRLVAALLTASADRRTRLRVWAFGDSPAAQRVASRTGLVAERTLLIMRRSLDDLPQPAVPDMTVIAPFRVGRDEQAWLTVNGRAFAHHPEQGSIDADDLAERMREPWFDPAGFFLARDADAPDGAVLGFHWTKEHEGSLGEVYVLGVDPDAQGRGLAKALLLTGLAHLHAGGDTEVELYVEADQPGPVGLYRSYGFVVASKDVLYAGPERR